MSTLRTCLLIALALGGAVQTSAQRQKPPVPDLTDGGSADEKHDWTLGPTGARGWIWGWKLETTDARQILVTEVAVPSPAAGKLRPGDVILGVGGELFERDPRIALGEAIGVAESPKAKGRLELTRWREGTVKTVRLTLPVLGTYGPEAPFACAKSEKILAAACDHIAAHPKGGIDGMVNALALLANGDRRHAGAVRDLARQVGRPDLELALQPRPPGLPAWQWGYRGVFLGEYYLATKDRKVLPAIAEYAGTIARGQSRVGTWGHGMAWPDLNGGALHGSLTGYGAVNQAGLVCHLALILAQECGVKDPEITQAIRRANRFAAFYQGKGAIPYGDHRPGWDRHDDNGKNSLAALIFDLQGMNEEAAFFGRMAAASYGEREQGHTGNYFSYLWGPIGVNRLGEEAVAAFLREQRWYYDLARAHDGSFPYQGGAGMSGGEHKYGNWDCTGAFVLASTFHERALFITGRGVDRKNKLSGKALEATIEAGRGYDCWTHGADFYAGKREAELWRDLESWSPAVRSRAAAALAVDGDVDPGKLRRMLRSKSLDAQYGACQGLAALGSKGAAAVPELQRGLQSDDVWLRIQAAFALSAIGDRARVAVPDLLELALLEDPEDPREITQRYLAFCLFYPGGALKMRGLISKDLGDVERADLLPVVERLLLNDDGRARGAVSTIFKLMTLEELKPILPQIVEAVRTPSPSGVMFSNGVRLAGLKFLAAHQIAEGMALCVEVTEIDKWGKQDRILSCLKTLEQYGGAAREVLPQLRNLEARLRAHPEARNLGQQIEACAAAIRVIEEAPSSPEVRTVAEIMGSRRRSR